MNSRPIALLPLAPLAACVALAVDGAGAATVARPLRHAADVGRVAAMLSRPVVATAPARPASVAQATTLAVTTCDDDGGFDTLRHAVLVANSGDVIDLSGLACATITLATGAIGVGVADLTIKGPGQAALTIDAHGASRVFTHGSAGTLTLQGFAVANGHVAAADARGGCIYSNATVVLDNVTVSGCSAEGTTYAVGGGLLAHYLTATSSRITGNSAHATVGIADTAVVIGGGFATLYLAKLTTTVISQNTASAAAGQARGGGGASIGGMNLVGSTITHNQAVASQVSYNASYGGGLWSTPGFGVLDSTIDNNSADAGGGILLAGGLDPTKFAVVRNTTISGNTANLGGGGFVAESSTGVTLTNSTIAFNVCNGSLGGGGLVISGPPKATIGSSIIADNASTGTTFAPDLSVDPSAVLSGSHDLIKLSDSMQLPADTIGDDPQLGPLKNNGGPTRTHAIGVGSPALDAGADGAGLNYDQRGAPFFRISGAQSDIGAFEFQDTIFASGFQPLF